MLLTDDNVRSLLLVVGATVLPAAGRRGPSMGALAVRAVLLAPSARHGGSGGGSSGGIAHATHGLHAAAAALWRWARCTHAARAEAAIRLSAFVHADHAAMRYGSGGESPDDHLS